MRRRGVGEGGLTKRRDGRWQASYTGSDGRRHYLYGKHRKVVAERLASALRDKGLGLYVAGQSHTVSDYLTRWLARADHLRPITLSRYETHVRLHVLPALGAMQLRQVQPQHIAALYDSLRGHKAPATIVQLHAVLHSAFDQALRWDLVARDPVAAVKPPKVERREMRIPPLPDIYRILTAVRDDSLEALYVLAVTTGARQGEILALRWQDVDFDTASLSISATLTRGQRVPPKTRASIRSVPLPDRAVTALRAHRRHMAEELLPLRTRPEGETLVFLVRGGPINGHHLTERSFKPLLKRHGLPALRFHDLRHVAASLMLSNGVPVHVVSKILGHSSPAVTLNVYAHVIPGDMESAVATLERALGGAG